MITETVTIKLSFDVEVQKGKKIDLKKTRQALKKQLQYVAIFYNQTKK